MADDARYFDTLSVRVPPSSPTGPLESHAIRYTVDPMMANPHGTSAAIRKWVNIKAFQYIFDQLQPNSLSLYWSSTRELNLAARTVFAQDQVLEVSRPIVDATDIARAGLRVPPIGPDFRRDCIYMQDTFRCGGIGFLEFLDREFADETTTRYLVWAGPRFDGLFGDRYEEGAWIRRNETDIEARADISAPSFPVHPALDWVHRAGARGNVAWSTVRSIADEDIVVFTRAVLAPHIDNTPLGCEKRVTIPSTSWVAPLVTSNLVQAIPTIGTLAYRWVGTEEYYDARLLRVLEAYLIQRRPTSWAFQSFLRHAVLHMEQTYPRTRELFPADWQVQLERHTAQAWFAAVHQAHRLATGAYIGTAAPAADIRAMMTSYDTHKPAMGFFKYLFMLVIWALVGLALCWLFRRYIGLSATKTVVAAIGYGMSLITTLPGRLLEYRPWNAVGNLLHLPWYMAAVVEETLPAIHPALASVNVVAELYQKNYLGALWHAGGVFNTNPFIWASIVATFMVEPQNNH